MPKMIFEGNSGNEVSVHSINEEVVVSIGDHGVYLSHDEATDMANWINLQLNKIEEQQINLLPRWKQLLSKI